jgi:preprotein translocase subunit SecY
MSSELARRIAFTLGALLLYRIASHIALPGINPGVWDQFFRSTSGGVLGMASTLSGGALARLSILSLGVVPYVSAAILMQVAILFVPALRAVRDAGESGRRRLDRYTMIVTALVAAIQSYGIAGGLQRVTHLVPEPGWLFTVTTVLTLVAGALVVVLLCNQITARGIGNGIALILCIGFVTGLPANIFGMLELGRQGHFSMGFIAGLALFAVALTAIVVRFEKARRLEPVEFAGRADVPAASAFLSFKLNGAGVIPTVMTSWVFTVVLVVASLLGAQEIGRMLNPGQPVYMICYAILIFFSVFIYAAFVADPGETAEKLRRLGGALPQIAPGEPTAAHLDRVLSRLTLIGAVYFVTVCLIPELLLLWAQVPFYFGGTALLVVVGTVLDIEQQAREFALVKN